MLHIYDTLARRKRAFQPIDAPNVSMYVCGMTVYDYCHLGHARLFLVFDMVVRWLRASGYQLTYVQNITDIDDKIINRALEQNKDIRDVTDFFIQAMHEDWSALDILSPDHQPRATEHIPDMINIISKLVEKGKAYRAENGDVYYSVRQFSSYGKLSGKDLNTLQAGERVDVDLYKRDPLDFVLWKHSKQGEPSWPSPWGGGRPGWHIECSAMSEHHFGVPFDIHGGGADLQFPHHENEIAQSEGIHDHPFVHYWMHNGFVRVDNEKMSKSLGNFLTIRDLLKQTNPEVVRFFILRSHYRSPINFAQESLEDAQQSLARLYRALEPFAHEMQFKETTIDWQKRSAQAFKQAMDDDFNSPEAIAILFDLASQLNKKVHLEQAIQLKTLASVLGLLDQNPRSFLQMRSTAWVDPKWIEQKIQERLQAKARRDFALADAIRDDLLQQGIVLEDKGPHSTVWRERSAREEEKTRI